jgi:hypothetical protein
MKRYRVYLLNDLGAIFQAEDVDAFDDADAIAAAWNLFDIHNANHPDIASYGVEVWDGGNLVFNSWTKSG